MSITSRYKQYLYDNEKVMFTESGFDVNEEQGFEALLTNQRLLLLKRFGLIFKQDKTHTVDLRQIVGTNLLTQGRIFKTMYLNIKTAAGDWEIFGDRGSLEKLHKAINKQKMILETPQPVIVETKPAVIVKEEEPTTTSNENQKKFVCKVCETEYPTKRAALICEKSHVPLKRQKRQVKAKATKKSKVSKTKNRR